MAKTNFFAVDLGATSGRTILGTIVEGKLQQRELTRFPNHIIEPDILDTSIITDIVEVSDDDAIHTARELARVQGLLVGTSSGANVWAAKQMAEKYGKDKIIATILADRAERYFSTSLI